MEFFDIISFKSVAVVLLLYGLFLRVRSDWRICEMMAANEAHTAMHAEATKPESELESEPEPVPEPVQLEEVNTTQPTVVPSGSGAV